MVSVFVGHFEVVPMSEDVFGSGVKGAFVRGYALAKNESDAMHKFEVALTEFGVSIVNAEWCVQNDAVEWENPDSEEGAAAIEEAKATGKVVFAEFHTWISDEEDEDEGLDTL